MGRVKEWYQKTLEQEEQWSDHEYIMNIVCNEQTRTTPTTVVKIQHKIVDNKSQLWYNTCIE